MAAADRNLRSPSVSAHPYHVALPSLEFTIHARLLAQAPEFRVLLCGYPSKVCLNHRARKRDGSLHRFCEDHRQRANETQKKWAQRRYSVMRGIVSTPTQTDTIEREEGSDPLPGSLQGSKASAEAVRITETQHAEKSSDRPTASLPMQLEEVRDDDALWQSLGLPELEDTVEYSF